MKKENFETRVNKAREQKELKHSEKTIILDMVKECLAHAQINVKASIVNINEIDFSRIQKISNRWVSCIFIQFTKSGHIAVVGAGADISFSYNSTTGKILTELNEAWDTESVILITIENLKSLGLKGCNNVLECRNGIENYIGSYLSDDKKIPVLNYYQHWNYKKDVWDEWKDNNYILNH